MFKDDNDEEEENTFGVTRYPCMPSLVALQQMRNRLHLAMLGRKLMKWTALATGTELRNTALQLDGAYQSFAEDMRNAYILLARCRYFYPNLNKMVVEGVPASANIVLLSTTKTASGVKILKYNIYDNNSHPYEHLGIEKGGQAIEDAKKAWLELLKRIILMVQLRTNFLLVEAVQRAANKKMNVLGKVVIPKVRVTCGYIENALEELARDEFYRRKMILGVKKKKNVEDIKTVPENEDYCTLCGETLCLDDIQSSSIYYDKIQKNKQLKEFKDQISEILEILQKVDEKYLQASNMEEFVSLSQELKCKIDEKLTTERSLPEPDNNQCQSCKNILENEEFAKLRHEGNLETDINELIPKSQSQKSLHESSERILNLENYHKPQISGMKKTDLNLGAFEIDVKEITKIVRSRNKDGTIREEKKIIKIRREVKDSVAQNLIPLSSSNDSANSNNDASIAYGPSASSSKSKHSHNTTIQMISVKEWIKKQLLSESVNDKNNLLSEIFHEESSKSNLEIPLHKSLFFNNSLANASFDLDPLHLKLKDNYFASFACKDEETEVEKYNVQELSNLVLKCNETSQSKTNENVKHNINIDKILSSTAKEVQQSECMEVSFENDKPTENQN